MYFATATNIIKYKQKYKIILKYKIIIEGFNIHNNLENYDHIIQIIVENKIVLLQFIKLDRKKLSNILK